MEDLRKIVNSLHNEASRDEAIKALDTLMSEGRLKIQRPPMKPVDRLYKKGCPNCGNDLVQPYMFCRFCGQEFER